MSNISKEPGNTISFISMKLHSDQYNITGMVAATNCCQSAMVDRDQILNMANADGLAVLTLNIYSAGSFLSVKNLSKTNISDWPVNRTAAIGAANMFI